MKTKQNIIDDFQNLTLDKYICLLMAEHKLDTLMRDNVAEWSGYSESLSGSYYRLYQDLLGSLLHDAKSGKLTKMEDEANEN